MLLGCGFNGFGQLQNLHRTSLNHNITLPVLIYKGETVKLKEVVCSWSKIFILTGEGSVLYRGHSSKASSQCAGVSEDWKRFTSAEVIRSLAASWSSLHFVNASGQVTTVTDGTIIDEATTWKSDEKFVKLFAGNSDVIGLTDSNKAFLSSSSSDLDIRSLLPKVKIKAVSCGKEHTLLLSNIGVVFSYGGGSRGQLGHGDAENQSEARTVEAMEGVSVVAIAAGGWHSMALTGEGSVLYRGHSSEASSQCAGVSEDWKRFTSAEVIHSLASSWSSLHLVNASGQVRTVTDGTSIDEATTWKSDEKFVKLFAGNSDVIGLTDSNEAFLSSSSSDLDIRSLLPKVKIKAVSCGKEHTLLLSNIGVVFSYGGGSRGQLGHGDAENQSEARIVEAMEGVSVVAIAAGGWHSMALTELETTKLIYGGDSSVRGDGGGRGCEVRADSTYTIPEDKACKNCWHSEDIGDVYTWGWNVDGQLGFPSQAVQEKNHIKPTFIPSKESALANIDAEKSPESKENTQCMADDSTVTIDPFKEMSSEEKSHYDFPNEDEQQKCQDVRKKTHGDCTKLQQTSQNDLGIHKSENPKSVDECFKTSEQCVMEKRKQTEDAGYDVLVTSHHEDVMAHKPEETEFVNFQVYPRLLEFAGGKEDVSVVSIACGSRHSACVTDDGEVYTWGWNQYGQLGLGHQNSHDSPQKLHITHATTQTPTRVHCGNWNTVIELG